MSDEVSMKRCKQCDYMSLDVPISRKKPLCGKSLDGKCLECDVYLTTERLKDRINYLNGKTGPLFIDGLDRCMDTFMQQMPAKADQKDLKKRVEALTQTSFNI